MDRCYSSAKSGSTHRCKEKIEPGKIYCTHHKEQGKMHTPLLSKFLKSNKEFSDLYRLGEELKTGGMFGTLFHVTHKTTRKPAVLKVRLEGSNYDYTGSITKEIEALESYSSQHHRIVQKIDTFQLVYHEENRLCIYGYTMEPLLCSLDSSQVNVKKHINTITEQLIEMVYQFHQGRKLHMDIKADNIGVRSIDPLELVLIDFGGCEEVMEQDRNRAYRTMGTQVYYSLLSETKPWLSYGDDLETVGYVIWKLTTGKLPWEHLLEEDNHRIAMKQSLQDAPPHIAAFIKECRRFNPTDKYSFPDYGHLLSILGGNPHTIRFHYILPHTTYSNYRRIEQLDQCDGIKGNKNNHEVLNDNRLYTINDIVHLRESHGIITCDDFYKYFVSIGIPGEDTSKFMRFGRLWGLVYFDK